VKKIGIVIPAYRESAGIHLELWKAAWRMFKDRPILGAGLSNYNTLFGHYHSLPFAGRPSWGNAHDTCLFQMAERGLIGLAALQVGMVWMPTLALYCWMGRSGGRADRRWGRLW